MADTPPMDAETKAGELREAEKRGERRAIARLVQVAADIAFHAGVGGRETAGAIASYLATKPEEIEPFVAGKLSAIDLSDDWIKGGCLSWHSVRGDIVHPEDLAKETSGER